MNKKGFTLIEFLIYITLTTVALVLITSMVMGLFWSKTKLTTAEEVGQNARFVLERVSASMRNAEGIGLPEPEQSGGTLSLAYGDSAKNPTVFSLSDGNLMIQEGTGDQAQLNSEHVRMTHLEFTNVSYEGTPGAVRTIITIEFLNPGQRVAYDFEQTFYLTAAIRP